MREHLTPLSDRSGGMLPPGGQLPDSLSNSVRIGPVGQSLLGSFPRLQRLPKSRLDQRIAPGGAPPARGLLVLPLSTGQNDGPFTTAPRNTRAEAQRLQVGVDDVERELGQRR